MATFLGVLNSLGFYDYVFPFILVFAITFGILSGFKPFGDNAGINTMVAIVMGFLIISFSHAVAFINMFMPFLMIALIIFLFMIMAFKFGGLKDETIITVLKHPAGFGMLIGIFIIIIATTLTYTQPSMFEMMLPVNESEISPEGFALTPDAQMKQTMQTLFHPTIIGIVIMLIVFAVTVYMVTYKSGGK